MTYIVLKLFKYSYTKIFLTYFQIYKDLYKFVFTDHRINFVPDLLSNNSTKVNIWWIGYSCNNMVVKIPCDETRVGVGATACCSTPNWRSTDTERPFPIPQFCGGLVFGGGGVPPHTSQHNKRITDHSECGSFNQTCFYLNILSTTKDFISFCRKRFQYFNSFNICIKMFHLLYLHFNMLLTNLPLFYMFTTKTKPFTFNANTSELS